jgi:spore coat-associated protein N
MQISLSSTGGKVLASTVLLGAAASVAGLGTFGTFTSTTAASATVASGTVRIAFGPGGSTNPLSVPVTGMVAGDTISQPVVLANTGDQDLSSVTLTTAATTSSRLDTDQVNGIQLQIQSCPVAWTQVGSAPRISYTCTSPTTVLASRPAIAAAVPVSPLTSLAAGKADNLLVKVTLPDTANNDFQGLSSVVGFSFTGTPRAAVAR